MYPRLQAIFLLLFSLRATAVVAHATPTDSARQTPQWRLGVVTGAVLQGIAAGKFPLSPSAEQRSPLGVQAGLIGRWGAKNGVWGFRLETTYTTVSHRWYDPDNSTDLRYHSNVIGVAPLLDVSLLRSRRLHLMAGAQINTYLPGTRVVGTELKNTRFVINNQLVDYGKTDGVFRVGNPLHLLLGATWEVRPRLEVGLRVERGGRVSLPILRYPVPSLTSPPFITRPIQSGRLVAARLAATWWLR